MKKIVRSILIDAVEGSGIAYWARGSNIVRDADGIVSFKVHDDAPDGEPVKKGSAIINERAIMKARDALVNGEVKVRRDIAAQFVGKPEDWEYDSEGVDALIQAAFFKEIAYG